MSEARSSVRRYAIAGLAAVGVLVGGLGIWAGLAPLSSAVIAPGVIVVDSSRKEVQHLEGGIVAALLVREGDHVRAGQPVVRLDATQAGARRTILQAELDVLRARRVRLKAEQHVGEGGALPPLAFPSALELRRLAEPSVAQILDGEFALFTARHAALKGRLAVLKTQPSLLREEIRGLEAQVAAKTRQIELIQQELAAQHKLLKKGHVPITRVLELERTAAALKGERGQRLAEIARARGSIGEAALREIELVTGFREGAVADLREAEARIFDLREQLLAAEDVLQRTELLAPATGHVVGLSVHTIGGVVAPGEVLMQIVPDKDALTIDVQVRPEDVDEVTPGQEADVRLTALDQTTTPTLKATVTAVSADRLVDEQSGLPYYRARLELTDEELSRLGEQTVVPGMPAEVFIRTGGRTVLNYLFKPLRDGFSRAFRES